MEVIPPNSHGAGKRHGAEKGGRSRLGPLALALAALAAVAIVAWATSPWPGVTVDSAEYLAVAEGVLTGEGFTMPYLGYDEPYRVLAPGERVPMTQFPPLYPALLALAQAVLPGGPFDAVRAVGAVLMGAMVASGMWVVRRQVQHRGPALIAGGLLLAPDLVTLHAMAWSEPPAVLALVGCLHFTASYLRERKGGDAALAFALGAVAALARFAGIAFIGATALCVLLYGLHALTRRGLVAISGALAAMLPVGLWFARNVSVSGEASEKDLAWHPPGGKQIVQAVEAVGAWALPSPVLPLAGGILLVLLAAVFVVRRSRIPRAESTPMARTCLVFFGVYLFFVVGTRTLLDQNVSMDLRILSPLHVIAVIGICSSLRMPTSNVLRKPLIVGLVVLSAASVARGLFVAARFSGISVAGYTGDEWRSSETLSAAARLDRDLPVATNAPDPLWLWHNRLPILVPPKSNRYSGEPNRDYLDQVAEVGERLGCDGVVVWFDQPTRKPPRIIDPVLAAALDLERTDDLMDGEIYEVARC